MERTRADKILRANYPETETERESNRIARGIILVTYIILDSLLNIITSAESGFRKENSTCKDEFTWVRYLAQAFVFIKLNTSIKFKH